VELLRAEDWPRIVRPGARVFIGSGAGVPRALVEGMLACAGKLRDVELVHIHTLGPVPWVDPRYAAQLRTNTFFLTPEVGRAVVEGRADYTPCSLSEVPRLFESTVLPIDVALVMTSPPDPSGKVSLGVSVDVVRSAVAAARVVVAQINRHMPRTSGDSTLDVSSIDAFVEHDEPLPEQQLPAVDSVRARIGAYLAELVEDGSTLQVGLGVTPQLAVASLRDHRHLGVHSGVFTDALMELVRCGAVDNSRKHFVPGRSVASHAMGTRALYEFVDGNPEVEFRGSGWVNDPANIARNERMVAVNGARQIDLTGQVVRDSAGHRFHGGVGAQLDFLRGSAASAGGRPIHVLPSTSRDGTKSRIVAKLPPATGVATSRADVHYIVTEHGVASLHGRSIRERALEMIQVAHPDFREELMRGAHERGWVPRFVSVAPSSLGTGEADSGLGLRRVRLGRSDEGYLLRPLHPSDIRRLQEFFYSHTEDTVRSRYGYLRQDMPADSAYELVGVDQSRDLALGLFEESGLGRAPVLRAVGRFYRDDDGASAEVAFVVHEAARRRGMASLLLEELAKVAERRGIERFWAEVLTGNEAMRSLFERFGAKSERSRDTEGDVYRMKVGGVLKKARKLAARREQAAGEGVATSLGWYWSEVCLEHDTGPGHPESPERYRVLGASLVEAATELGAVAISGREATREELMRCHTAQYLDLVHIDVEGLADQLRTGDTPICPESEKVAKRAAGAGLEAVEAVMEGRLKRVFVAVRPPGHHATPVRGMGFCIYNTVALMARHAQSAFGCGPVLIVDWDVHHGNGTQDIFYADSSVFYFSIHEQGLYPFTGAAAEIGDGPGAGATLNVPLAPGSGIDEVLPAFDEHLLPAMEEFRPELVLVSAGFDSRAGDPLGGLGLRDEDFATMTRRLRTIADRWAQGRLISVLEGGYNPAGLASAADAHFRALAE